MEQTLHLVAMAAASCLSVCQEDWMCELLEASTQFTFSSAQGLEDKVSGRESCSLFFFKPPNTMCMSSSSTRSGWCDSIVHDQWAAKKCVCKLGWMVLIRCLRRRGGKHLLLFPLNLVSVINCTMRLLWMFRCARLHLVPLRCNKME